MTCGGKIHTPSPTYVRLTINEKHKKEMDNKVSFSSQKLLRKMSIRLTTYIRHVRHRPCGF
ncbi:unnamed protein product [Sphenostylis stenocarpa]|uniref:Uncharacterized protein n=1 Tax=Sphenostylis stenocarpa TaxID=92480 RepID=A0AA86W240_9FABA|nr:unnamed protein product [Sphenostylis stenocarpa]